MATWVTLDDGVAWGINFEGTIIRTGWVILLLEIWSLLMCFKVLQEDI
jgi:hypothetical protein